MRKLTAATCLFASLTWVSAAQAVCPSSHIKVFGSDSYPTTATYDHPYVKYDLPAGTLYARVLAFAYSSDQTIVEASDEYWLEGPASSDPIAFTANLHATGTASSHEMKTPNYCSGSGITGGLKSGAAEEYASQGASQCVDHTLDQVATLPLQKLPGEVFPLTIIGRATANSADGFINGALTFTVPAGYTVRSCHGYVSLPTPTVDRSWGHLKASYR